MFSDAIIEPLQKSFAYKECKITAHKKSFFLRILPNLQDFFDISATNSTIRIGRKMLCLLYTMQLNVPVPGPRRRA